MITTYNFREENYSYVIPPSMSRVTYHDRRHSIDCYEPSCNLECYLNYLDYLNRHMDRWVNYGYLDMGMVPLGFAPTFLQGVWNEYVSTYLVKNGIPYEMMPAISLFSNKYKSRAHDIWAFKSDIAKALDMKESDITAASVLYKIIPKEER